MTSHDPAQARNQMSELERSVLLFLEELEQFYPGLPADDYRTLLLEISETLFTEQSLQDLAQDETRVLKLKSSLCTVLKWMRTVEGKDEETQSLTAAFDGKEVEIVKNAIENALLHVYVTLDVQALERQARINERINELATWRIQAYSMRQ